MAKFLMEGFSDLSNDAKRKYISLTSKAATAAAQDYPELARNIEATLQAGPGEGSLLTREEFSASLKRSLAKYGGKRLLKTLKNGPGF